MPKATKASILAIIILLPLLVVLLLVGYLFCFHVYLIATNQTTSEFNKERRIKSLSKGFVNNFYELFCSSLTPSFEFPLKIHKKEVQNNLYLTQTYYDVDMVSNQ